jgi:selenocysteine-specific elongation factor
MTLEHKIQIKTKFNKCLMVEEEFVDLIQEEIADILRKTRFVDAPIMRTDALTTEGLPELCITIDRVLDTIPPKRDFDRPRLPIDRAFTIKITFRRNSI